MSLFLRSTIFSLYFVRVDRFFIGLHYTRERYFIFFESRKVDCMNNVFSYCMRQFVKRSVIRVPGRKIFFFFRGMVLCVINVFPPKCYARNFVTHLNSMDKGRRGWFFFIILRTNIISWDDHRQAKSCISWYHPIDYRTIYDIICCGLCPLYIGIPLTGECWNESVNNKLHKRVSTKEVLWW